MLVLEYQIKSIHSFSQNLHGLDPIVVELRKLGLVPKAWSEGLGLNRVTSLKTVMSLNNSDRLVNIFKRADFIQTIFKTVKSLLWVFRLVLPVNVVI
jgi:hypothetical protein